MLIRCPSCNLYANNENLIPVGDSYVCPNCKERCRDEIVSGKIKPVSSRTGITSLVIGIVSFLLAFVSIVLAGYFETITEGGMDDSAATLVGSMIILSLLLSAISFILGIVSLFHKGARKVFGIIAISLNVVLIFAIITLMIIGATVGS